jgi:hypothetical protein
MSQNRTLIDEQVQLEYRATKEETPRNECSTNYNTITSVIVILCVYHFNLVAYQ